MVLSIIKLLKCRQTRKRTAEVRVNRFPLVANRRSLHHHFRMIHENEIRRLRYRLNRQGMLELDAWLAPLELALEEGDGETVARVEVIVATDTPELLAMMHGETDIPNELRPWLDR